MDHHSQDVPWRGKDCVCPDCVLESKTLGFVTYGSEALVLTQELIDLVIWGVDYHEVILIVDQGVIMAALSHLNSLPKFPVSLSIKLISFDENRSRGLGSLKQEKVCGNALSLGNLDDLTDHDIFGGNTHDAALTVYLRSQKAILGIVKLFVSLVSHEVIIELFNHSDEEDENEGCHVGEEETDLQEWHKLG